MEVCKASGGLGLGLAQCHLHCIVLDKEHHKSGLDSRVGGKTPSANRKSYKVTLQKDVYTGRRITEVNVARNIPKKYSLSWG